MAAAVEIGSKPVIKQGNVKWQKTLISLVVKAG